jgi:hypothetical protein
LLKVHIQGAIRICSDCSAHQSEMRSIMGPKSHDLADVVNQRLRETALLFR